LEPICPYLLAILAVVLGLQPMIDATMGSELYRALLSCTAAACAGWIVAYVYRSRRTLAVGTVVVALGVSLLISLFTGPGYYLRDFVLIASITVSPVIGGVWLPRLTRRTKGRTIAAV
jgi:hypothetical protein